MTSTFHSWGGPEFGSQDLPQATHSHLQLQLHGIQHHLLTSLVTYMHVYMRHRHMHRVTEEDPDFHL